MAGIRKAQVHRSLKRRWKVEDPSCKSARVRDDGQTNAAIFLAIARKARGCASWFSSFKSSFLSTGAICYLLQGVSVPLKSRIVAPYIFHSTASISSL